MVLNEHSLRYRFSLSQTRKGLLDTQNSSHRSFPGLVAQLGAIHCRIKRRRAPKNRDHDNTPHSHDPLRGTPPQVHKMVPERTLDALLFQARIRRKHPVSDVLNLESHFERRIIWAGRLATYSALEAPMGGALQDMSAACSCQTDYIYSLAVQSLRRRTDSPATLSAVLAAGK